MAKSTIEEIVTQLKVELDPSIGSQLSRFHGLITKALTNLPVLAAGATAALAGLVHSTVTAADNIGDVSERIGVNNTALQELKFAAEQTDASFDDLVTGLKFISKNAVDAANGSKDLQKAFGDIPLRDVNGNIRPANELLLSFADRIADIPDEATRVNVAVKILGRNAIQLLPALKKGSEGLTEFARAAHEAGIIFSPEDIARAQKYDDSLKVLRARFMGLRNDIGTPFIEGFTIAIMMAGDAVKWVRKNIQFLTIATGLLGAALVALNLSKVIANLSALSTSLGSLLIRFGPIGAILTTIALVIDDLIVFMRGGRSVLGTFINSLNEISNSPVAEYFKSLLALLFDFGNPDNWKRVEKAAFQLTHILERMFIALGELIQNAIIESIFSALSTLLNKLPTPIRKLLGGDFKVSFEGTKDQAGRLAALSQQAFPPSNTPSVISAGPTNTNNNTVTQTNNVTVQVGTPIELERTIRQAINKANQEALAAGSGGR